MISDYIVKAAEEYYFGGKTREEQEIIMEGWQEEIRGKLNIKRKLIEAKNGKEIPGLVKELDEELSDYVENKVQIACFVRITFS